MSAPDASALPEPAVGVTLATALSDVVELAALRDRAQVLKTLAARRALNLPSFGRVAIARDTLALCVRPERWLLLAPPASPDVTASLWQRACEGVAAAVDLSSGLVALHLDGPHAREALARGCRLDLDPDVFPAGHAAATIIAQVSTILAAVPAGMLILTPTSTARHFQAWLARAARPFGLAARADVTVGALSGDSRA